MVYRQIRCISALIWLVAASPLWGEIRGLARATAQKCLTGTVDQQ